MNNTSIYTHQVALLVYEEANKWDNAKPVLVFDSMIAGLRIVAGMVTLREFMLEVK